MVEGIDGGGRGGAGDVVESSREDLLAENRARRAAIRDEEAAKAARTAGSDHATGVDVGSHDEEAMAGDDASDSATSFSRRHGRLVIALAVSTCVLAVAVAVLGVLLATAGSGSEGGAADRQAIDDAKVYATTVLTYTSGDYADLDKRIRAISTPQFADRYIKSSQQAREGNDAAKASGTATAKEAGLISRADDAAVVLVAIDQNVKSPMVPAVGDGIGYQSRVKITLTRDGDDWKLSDLSVV